MYNQRQRIRRSKETVSINKCRGFNFIRVLHDYIDINVVFFSIAVRNADNKQIEAFRIEEHRKIPNNHLNYSQFITAEY